MAQSDSYYPPAAFYFEVTMRGDSGVSGGKSELDGAFQEVSGLDRELEFEEVREGGQNLFSHRLPKRPKHGNLVLKRGVVTKSSKLADWAEATLTSVLSKPIELKEVTVTLLAEGGKPLVWWTFADAYPVKWQTAALNSTNAAIAVETLEIAYSWVKRTVSKDQPAE